MENTEIIKALRWCGSEDERHEMCVDETYRCPMWNEDRITDECKADLMLASADALEATERLLDQNTKRCEALRKQLREAHESYEKHLNELEAQNELKDGTITAMATDIGKLQAAVDNYENIIAELSAQIPKEGEWIQKEIKKYCPRDCWYPSTFAIEGTWNEKEGSYMELEDGFCSVCLKQDDQYYKDKHCPNCGARMRGEKQC